MRSKKKSVLVVDDDARILRMVKLTLEMEGFRVLPTKNGEAALEVLIENNPDLVLLDIMLPGIDGFTVCRRIREFSQVPIIMITAKSEVEEKALGLDTGADDYITKPFSVIELTARIQAVLRRTRSLDERAEPVFRSGGLVIDFAQHTVTLCGKGIGLSATEYRLLCSMARNAGRVVTPDQLLEEVWGEQYFGEYQILRVNIARLRNMLGDSRKKPKFIATRTGIGYEFLINPDSVPQALPVGQ